MQYEERYEVRARKGTKWETENTYDNEGDAEYEMRWLSDQGDGSWRVVRIMEVTVVSVSKASR